MFTDMLYQMNQCHPQKQRKSKSLIIILPDNKKRLKQNKKSETKQNKKSYILNATIRECIIVTPPKKKQGR